MHVTVKLRQQLPALRRRDAHAVLRAACAAGCERFGFRLVHYAILNDHLHFLAEAKDRAALRRGLQGLLVRIALVYVFGNGKKHAAAGRMVAVPQAIDTYTSAPWFFGFRERIVARGLEAIVRPVAAARTWLLTIGWRRHGMLSVHETPA